jgi:hypothetical protein
MENIYPYDDYKIIQKKTEGFIECILDSAYYFECYTKIKPTIFMSNDVLAIITKGTRDAITSYKYGELMTICGYELEIVPGKNKLYLGYRLSELQWQKKRKTD